MQESGLHLNHQCDRVGPESFSDRSASPGRHSPVVGRYSLLSAQRSLRGVIVGPLARGGPNILYTFLSHAGQMSERVQQQPLTT